MLLALCPAARSRSLHPVLLLTCLAGVYLTKRDTFLNWCGSWPTARRSLLAPERCDHRPAISPLAAVPAMEVAPPRYLPP